MASATFPVSADAIPVAPASAAPFAKNTEHVTQALNLLILQYVDKPRIRALVSAYIKQVQLLEDAIFSYQDGRALDVATGVNVDWYGEIVDEPRLALSDADYRKFIRAKIIVNGSDGSLEVMQAILDTILDNPPNGTFRVRDSPPAGFTVQFFAPTSYDHERIARLLIKARAAGVNLNVTFALNPTNTMFTLSHAAAGTPVFNAALGLDHVLIPNTGTGKLARTIGGSR